MKPIERFEKYNGESVLKDIYRFCSDNPNKYKHGCYFCPLFGDCDSTGTKDIETIRNIMLCKNTGGPVCWEKYLDEFYKNNHKTAYEVDLERREHLYPKDGWR